MSSQVDGDVDTFRQCLRMTPGVFEELFDAVCDEIRADNTNFRQSIQPELKLVITLKYLAYGETYASLEKQFRVSASAISIFVPKVCMAIYQSLRDDHMKMPRTAAEWEAISRQFRDRWQMVQCIGALDGKHVAIRRPAKSGSFFFNYKGFFSLVLLAMVDADYKFTYVEVGSEGRASDAGVWKSSSLFKALYDQQNPLDLPGPVQIDGIDEPVPYFIVADDAFPLTTHVMKPYSRTNLSAPQRIFNYRVSRARMVVESAFGILTSKFRVLQGTMLLSPDNAEVVIVACCTLHNFLRRRCGKSYFNQAAPAPAAPGAANPPVAGVRQPNASTSAKAQRDSLAEYFVSEQGEVPWQYERVFTL